jgi:hypothetical protein
MKDIPHHMVDFIKNYTKSENPKDNKVLKEFEKEHPKREEKKKKKAQTKKEREERTPEDLTPEQCNRKMKKRVPRMRERSHKTFF